MSVNPDDREAQNTVQADILSGSADLGSSADASSSQKQLQFSVDQVFLPNFTFDEPLMHRFVEHLGEQQWDEARAEWKKMRDIVGTDQKSHISLEILSIYADFVEGQIPRAVSRYKKLIATYNHAKDPTFVADLYLLSIYGALLSSEVNVLELPETVVAENSWANSKVPKLIYQAKRQKDAKAVTELGTIADKIIRIPGLARYNAVWLRAIQGNVLLYRGDFVWAERVFTYTLDRAETLMEWNQPLIAAVQRDLAIAQNGVQNLSFK